MAAAWPKEWQRPGEASVPRLPAAFGPSVTVWLCVCSQAVSSGDEKEGLKHPGLMLKYSTYKNLAQLAAQREDLETAMEFYLEVRRGRGAPPGGVESPWWRGEVVVLLAAKN